MTILFFAVNLESTFIKRDINILRAENDVTLFTFNENSLIRTFNLIRTHDLIFCWFASIRFFIPILIAKLLRKKIIIVAGGYDVAKEKGIECSSMCSIWKSLIVKSMLKLSDNILAVSNSNKKEIIVNCKINPLKIEMIYHGFEKINRVDLFNKSDIILSIGYIDKLSFYRKGIDRFFNLAEYLPEIKFHIAGKINLTLDQIKIPKNVILDGFIKQEELIRLMESAKLYIQFSRHEGFGCSVAEAMQYGCIPIVSKSFSLPEVAGDCGLIINDFDNYDGISYKVKNILENYNDELALKCIERVNNKFSYNKRADKIISIVKKLDSYT